MKFPGFKQGDRIAALVVRKPKATVVEASPQSLVERDELLAKAVAVVPYDTPDRNAVAAETVVAMRRRVKAVKAAREELAGPLRETLDKLMDIQKAYCGPLEAEIDRIETLAGEFDGRQKEAARKAEAAASAELKRLEDERRSSEAALETAKGRKAETIERGLEENRAKFNELVVAKAPEPAKARGQTTREVLKWELVDKEAAFRAMPHLFDVTIRPSAVNACCVPGAGKTKDDPETELYAGIRCWWEKSTTFADRG